jgi:hypothetical protein
MGIGTIVLLLAICFLMYQMVEFNIDIAKEKPWPWTKFKPTSQNQRR